ncbi:hypothetical protein GOODEAATRI_027283 [Goodea atripinnis]
MQAFRVSFTYFITHSLHSLHYLSVPEWYHKSHIKLSGHSPPAPKHVGDRFSDYSKNNQPNLLLCSSTAGAVYSGVCGSLLNILTLCRFRTTVLHAIQAKARINT